MKIHNPGNTYKIDVLYAWLSVDENGNEGIIAATVGPLVFGDIKLCEKLKPIVENAMKNTGMKARLVSFSNKMTLSELGHVGTNQESHE